MNMRKLMPLFAAFAVVAVAAGTPPAASFADTATTTASTTVQAQLSLIASLEQQIQSLMQQIANLRQQQLSATVSLVQSLSLGATGDQVKVLQALLAAEPGIYPEGLVTGYFGPLTEAAVKRFQKENDIEQAGVVGPQTREKLNELLQEHPLEFENENATSTATSTMNGEGNGEGENQNQNQNENEGEHGSGMGQGSGNARGEAHGRLCAIVPPGHFIAPGWLREKGDNEVPVIPTCQTLPPGIENLLNVPSTTPTSTTTTTVSLSISDIAYSAASTTATVSWTTNEAATGEVYYGTATPLDLAATSTATVSTSATSTAHSFNLTGLGASTTYYFVVQSTDASGNTATSSEQSQSFMTTGS